MEHLREAPLRAARLAIAAGLLALLAGCVATESGLWPSQVISDAKPCQLVCMWQNSMHTTQDSANGGATVQGFAGRVYLFGPNMDHPMQCEGKLTVDFIDETYDPSRWVERWNYDPVTLARLMKKDIIGCGYTVFLPTRDYKPDMTKIRLRASFTPPKGATIFTENVVTLASENGVIREVSQAPMTFGATTTVNKPSSQAVKTTFKPPISLR